MLPFRFRLIIFEMLQHKNKTHEIDANHKTDPVTKL